MSVTNVEVFGDGRFAKDMMIAGMPVRFEERFIRMEKDHLLETHSEPRLGAEVLQANVL